MKNYAKLSFLFVFTLIFTSCMPDVMELWINDDESGKMEMSFDMGEMMGGVEAMMSQMDANEDGTPKKKKDMWDGEEKMDSTIVFYDQLTDSLKMHLPNAKLLKNMTANISMDPKAEEATMTMRFVYKNDEELVKMLEVLKASKQGNDKSMMAMAGEENEIESMMIDYKLDRERGIIRVPAMDLSELEDDPEFMEIFGSMDSLALEDPESMMLLEMMFGGTTKTIIHTPNDVEFTNDYKAVVKGNTVTFEDNMLEYMKSGGSKERIIKFKN